jgi:site-specific DNA-adenine methylase
MARHYGIPYMGSKQKLVDKIIPFIINRHPNADAFYDLFGGGGSVALYAVRKYPHLDVVYNERSKAVSALMKYLREGGEIPFNFVKRSDFTRLYTGDDWYAGLLQTCWTFGNNQKSYLYGLPIQDFKEQLTELVMTGKGNIGELEQKANTIIAEEFGKELGVHIFLNPDRYRTPYQRRILLGRQIPLLGALQHMSRLERLVQIENMPGISTLGIECGKSYDEVPILGVCPIVYCDPPYENTAEYREGDFNHKQFYSWVMSRKYPVYVSSYKVTDPRLKLVKAIRTRSLLNSSRSKESSYNYENIYWNGVS